MLKEVIDGKRVVFSSISLQADALITNVSSNKSVSLVKNIQRQSKHVDLQNSVALQDLHSLGGITAYSNWSTGVGNFKKARAVPVGAKVYSSWETKPQGFCITDPLKVYAPANVCAWFKMHPRARRCIAVV